MRSHVSRFIHWVIIAALTVPNLPVSARPIQQTNNSIADTAVRLPLPGQESETTSLMLEPASAVISGTLPDAAEVLSPTLSLKADPDYLLPGKEIALEWELTNWTGRLEGHYLAWELAPGFIPIDVKDGFDPLTGKLVILLPGLSGELHLAPPETLPASASFALHLVKNESPVLEAQLNLEQLILEPVSSSGGIAQSLDGRVTVQFPAGSASDLKVSISPPRSHDVPSLSGAPFEILAFDAATLSEVHQFNQPVAITVNYREDEFKGDETTLTLFYYDESLHTWRPLQSQVDIQNNLLTAWSDHLTLMDFNTQDWEAARLPSIAGFQVAAFTGAATSSFPIEVPPGPGGLQPSLALSYNSQAVDSASSRT